MRHKRTFIKQTGWYLRFQQEPRRKTDCKTLLRHSYERWIDGSVEYPVDENTPRTWLLKVKDCLISLFYGFILLCWQIVPRWTARAMCYSYCVQVSSCPFRFSETSYHDPVFDTWLFSAWGSLDWMCCNGFSVQVQWAHFSCWCCFSCRIMLPKHSLHVGIMTAACFQVIVFRFWPVLK